MGNNLALKKLTLTALLLAMCIIGANIKILGSIALDSAPAFLGAILLGPWIGAFLGFFGHMTSAMLSGFPLTLPIHLIIGALMALCMFAFGWIRKKMGVNRLSAIILADIVGYIINVPLEIPLLYPLLKGAIIALFVPLTVATIFNIVICEALYVVLPQRVKQADFLEGHV